MVISEKLDSARIVYTLGLLDACSLEARTLDVQICENWTLGFWSLGPKKLKLNFTVKDAVADYDIFNSRF